MKDVIQKNVEAGVETIFKMKLTRKMFLVKNFTVDNIEVRLGDNMTKSVIGAGSYEVIYNNDDEDRMKDASKTNIVKVKAQAGGLVEVAAID